jgi:putative ABC transport system substrate-binding protein
MAGVAEPKHLRMLQDAAAARGVTLSTFSVSRFEQVLPALDAAKASGVQALHFLTGPLFSTPGSQTGNLVIERVAALRLPAMHQWPDTVDEGGLIAYGTRFTEVLRQRARLLVKVLRGAKPAELPVQRATKFEMIFNLKTAKALGLELHPQVLATADEAIE